MRKCLLDMRKDFLVMSNFYPAEILGKPNSLTIVASKKKYSKWAIMCSLWVFFFSQWESGICIMKIFHNGNL